MKKIVFLLLSFVVLSICSGYAEKQTKLSAIAFFSLHNEQNGLFKSAEVKPYKVTIQMGSSFLNLNYNAGETPSFDFTPPAGIKIESVLKNGIDVTNQLINNIYTLAPITENVLLVVSTTKDNSTSTQAPTINFKVYVSNKKITIKELVLGQTIELFDITGKLLNSIKSTGETCTLTVEKSGMYLVRIEKKCYKLVI